MLKINNNDIILLVIYIDDIIIVGSDASAIEHTKFNMNKAFDMIDLGLLLYCLGVAILQIGNNIFTHKKIC